MSDKLDGLVCSHLFPRRLGALKEAIGKAEVLIEALAYIRTFRDHCVIIKLGGSVMDDISVMRAILQDVVFMETVGVRPVVVHGGGVDDDGVRANS